MKKLFLTSVILATFTLFATACGDDSSSGPEEESSSSIEAEDESSSSVEEGKSSAADKKSSSSEAKKGDSSSSEKTTSSSSEAVSSSSEITRSSDRDVNKLYCDVKVDGDLLTIAYGVGGVFEETFTQDASTSKLTFVYEGSSCDNIVDFDFIGNLESAASFSCEINDCVVGNKWAKKTAACTLLASNVHLSSAEDYESLCDAFRHTEVTTDYLNKKMLDEGKYGVTVDTRDYAIYRTIKIGNQTWMAQNLNYVTHDGNADDGVSSWCYEDPESCAKYGRLYTWAAAMDKPESSCGDGHICGMTGTVQGICPDGWHLPSKEELHELFSFVGTGVDSITMATGAYAYDAAGTMLRNPTEWTLGGKAESGVEIPEGLDEYGFSALPAGYYGAGYVDVGSWVYFWSSSEIGERNVYMAAIGTSYDDETSLFVEGKGYGQSVRCIKDDAPSQSVSSN
ncbi:MAG: fibrobacter succinogenes major paralogous domain-containing protein [Fibrobacter sp.]|nr:fibrobacter succinogenes major paralogous domain-containing protein [Fibrobacter sp.]